MRFDIDTAREILQQVEDCPHADGRSPINIVIEGLSIADRSYHVTILHDAGLVEISNQSTRGGGPDFHPTRLTYAGHEFLTASKSNTAWDAAKSHIVAAGGAITLEAMKVALTIAIGDLAAGRIPFTR